MTEENKITNSHDKFFKAVFSRREEALSFLRSTLPAEIIRKITPESIKLANTHYISKELQESMSDIVYEADFEGFPVKLTFIIEHKSYIPQFPFIQFFLYFANCIQEQVKQKKKNEPIQLALPIIIVVHHSNAEWKIKPIWQYFGNVPELLRTFVPSIEYLLVDLTKDDYDKIKGRYDSLILQMSFMTMKGVFDAKRYEEITVDVFAGLNEVLSTESGSDFFETLLKYIYEKIDLDEDRFVKIITEITNRGGDKVMTVADRLRAKGRQEGILEGILEGMQEGRQEGLQEGRQEGRQEGMQEGMQKGMQKGIQEGFILDKAENALRMFAMNFEIDVIIKITQLSDVEVKLLSALYNQLNDKAIEHIEIIDGKVNLK